MYTRAEIKNKIKRRLRILHATTGPSSETEEGNIFSDDAINDAIQYAREKIVIDFEKYNFWAEQSAYFSTEEDVVDYTLDSNVISIRAVYYDVNADGTLKSDSVKCTKLLTPDEEAFALDDPFLEPSTSDPLYRIVNKGLRILTATDFSMTPLKVIRIDYIGKLTGLTGDSSTSNLPDYLDELTIDLAVYWLEESHDKEVAQSALNIYMMSMTKADINARRNS